MIVSLIIAWSVYDVKLSPIWFPAPSLNHGCLDRAGGQTITDDKRFVPEQKVAQRTFARASHSK